MTDAPERIFATPTMFGQSKEGGYWSIHERKDGRSTAFVRADLVRKLAKEAESAASTANFEGDISTADYTLAAINAVNAALGDDPVKDFD